MIDGRVEPEIVLYIRALLGASRDAGRPRSSDLGELANQRPDQSTRCRDDHRFPWRGLPDHAQARIRDESGHPKYAEPGCYRPDGGTSLRRSARSERVRTPPRLSKNDVAFRVSGMLRGDHRRNGFASHDTTKRDRRRIRLPIIHLTAHAGVERKILDPKQHLPRACRDRSFLNAEVGRLIFTSRSGSKDDCGKRLLRSYPYLYGSC